MISSAWSEGGGVQICRGWRSIRWPSVMVAGGDGKTSAKTAHPPTWPSQTWKHGNCLLMTPADCTFDLVINWGDMDRVM